MKNTKKEDTEKLFWMDSDTNIPESDTTVSHMYKLDHINEGREQIEALLNKYSKVTSKGEYDIGTARLPPMHVDTGQHPPIYIPPRRMSPVIKSKLNTHIDSMYKAGIIGKSKSSWSFPLVPVLKKDGTVRPCADLRQLNTICRWEAHPLPHL